MNCIQLVLWLSQPASQPASKYKDDSDHFQIALSSAKPNQTEPSRVKSRQTANPAARHIIIMDYLADETRGGKGETERERENERLGKT